MVKKVLVITLSVLGLLILAGIAYLAIPPVVVVPPEKVAVVLQPEKVVVTVVPEKVAIIVPPVAIVVPKKVIKPTIPQVIFIGVTTVNPVDLSESDNLNNNIIVTFTEAMDSKSVNENTFQVKKTDGGDIKGVINSDESKKVWTFNPKDKLDIKSEYTVTITKSAKGVSGNSLVENFVWSFTTRSGGGSSGGGSSSSSSTPEPAPPAAAVLTTLTVSPTSANLSIGNTRQLNATTLDQYSTHFDAGVTYTTSNSSIATVNTSGFVTAVAGGNVTITGMSGTVNGSSMIIVNAIGASNRAAVNLGVAANYSIIAQTLISDATPAASLITGNIAIDPAAGSLISGISCTKVVGNIYDNNAGYTGGYDSNVTCLITDGVATLAAQSAMVTAYGDAIGRSLPDTTELGAAGDITGLTITPGLHKWSTAVNIGAGGVTLDCQGNTSAVFIFQISQDLTVANGATVNIGVCQAQNIFWQTDTQAVLGTTSVFNGNILAGTAVVINSGATLNGRAFAQSAVTLNDNTITRPN